MARDSDMFRLYWLSSKGDISFSGRFFKIYVYIGINKGEICSL